MSNDMINNIRKSADGRDSFYKQNEALTTQFCEGKLYRIIAIYWY